MLTHRGQTLGEIEKFDDPRSDEEEEESEEKGKLGGEHYYIATGHCSGDA